MAQEYLKPAKFENNFSSKNSQAHFYDLVKKQCVKMSFQGYFHVSLVFFRSGLMFFL